MKKQNNVEEVNEELKDTSAGAKCAYGDGVFDVGVNDLVAHPTALKFWERKREFTVKDKETGEFVKKEKDTEDNVAIREDIRRKMVQNAIEVIPGEKNGQYLVVDGVSRWYAVMAIGYGLIPCRIVNLKPNEVDGYILSKNAMRHQLTTGQRVMRYLLENERDVLDDIKYGRLFLGTKSDSRESDGNFTPVNIAKVLGCSREDALLGLELLHSKRNGKRRVVHPSGTIIWDDADKRVGKLIAEAFENVLLGITPIRRVRAAIGGTVATAGQSKAAANYGARVDELIVTLGNAFKDENWITIPELDRPKYAARLRDVLAVAPPEIKALIKVK